MPFSFVLSTETLPFYALSAAAGLLAHKRFEIALLDKPVALLLPVTLIAALLQVANATTAYHPAMDNGILALPVAFAVHYAWMKFAGNARPWQHLLGYVFATLLVGFELGYRLEGAPEDAGWCAGVLIALSAGLLLLVSRLNEEIGVLRELKLLVMGETVAILASMLGLFGLASLHEPVAAFGQSYIPLLNIAELAEALSLATLIFAVRRAPLQPEFLSLLKVLTNIFGFALVNAIALRTLSHTMDLVYLSPEMFNTPATQTLLTILWTVMAMAAMLFASKGGERIIWSAGAVLLAIVVMKLFFVDLANTGTLSRIVSFLGVGMLTLVLGYLAPMPPKERQLTA